jgi:hypothetical protein
MHIAFSISSVFARLLVISLLFVGGTARAQWTFIGPIPYLSTADSPFPLDGSNPTFHLEDFEPSPGCIPDELNPCVGDFDVPGARMVRGNIGLFSSVDADDGVIDGSGADGFSASARTVFISGSSSFVAFDVEFNAEELGFLPNAVGFVLTDGAGRGSGLLAFDAAGNQADFFTWDIESDALTTSDDRFVGVINLHGISKVTFGKTILDANPTANPRIDHFQYGFIPEPASAYLCIVVLACIGGVAFLKAWRRNHHHQRYGTT